jgi:hypothetical protein
VVEALRPDAPAAASKVQAVIAGRLARLSPEAAAVAGLPPPSAGRFTADVLAAASGLDDPAFVASAGRAMAPAASCARTAERLRLHHHGRIPGRRLRRARPRPPPPSAPRDRAKRSEAANTRPRRRSRRTTTRRARTAQAIRWYERAAEAAQWLHAHADAVRALERALIPVRAAAGRSRHRRAQLRLLTALPAPLLALEGYASERMTLMHTRALQLAGQLGSDPSRRWSGRWRWPRLVRGEWEPARDFAGRLPRPGRTRRRPRVLWVESDYLRGIAAYWPGRLTEARGHFEAAMERFRPERRRAHVLRYGQGPGAPGPAGAWRTRCGCWATPSRPDRQRDLALRAGRRVQPRYSRAVVWVWAAIVRRGPRRGRGGFAATSGSSPLPRRTKVPPSPGWRPSCFAAPPFRP